jgi:hypothetical protein
MLNADLQISADKKSKINVKKSAKKSIKGKKKNTMTTFKSTFEKYNWDEIQSKIYASTSKQVSKR